MILFYNIMWFCLVGMYPVPVMPGGGGGPPKFREIEFSLAKFKDLSDFEVVDVTRWGGGGGGVGTGVKGGLPAEVKSITGFSTLLNLYLGCLFWCQNPELVDLGLGNVPEKEV